MNRRAVQLPFVTDGNFNQGSGSMLACARTASPTPRNAEKKHNPGPGGSTQQHLEELQSHGTPLILESPLRPNLKLCPLSVRLLGQLRHKFRALQRSPILLIEIGDDRLQFRCVESFDSFHCSFQLAHLSLTLCGDLLFGDRDQPIARDERSPNDEKKSTCIHKGNKRKQPHHSSLDRKRHDPRKCEQDSQRKKRNGSSIDQATTESERLEGPAERIGQKLEEQVDAGESQKAIANNTDNLGCGGS